MRSHHDPHGVVRRQRQVVVLLHAYGFDHQGEVHKTALQALLHGVGVASVELAGHARVVATQLGKGVGQHTHGLGLARAYAHDACDFAPGAHLVLGLLY